MRDTRRRAPWCGRGFETGRGAFGADTVRRVLDSGIWASRHEAERPNVCTPSSPTIVVKDNAVGKAVLDGLRNAASTRALGRVRQQCPAVKVVGGTRPENKQCWWRCGRTRSCGSCRWRSRRRSAGPTAEPGVAASYGGKATQWHRCVGWRARRVARLAIAIEATRHGRRSGTNPYS